MTERGKSGLAFLMQLLPLALVVLVLFMGTAPPDNPSGQPGVMAFRAIGSWYAFPLSILLGILGVVAIFSRVGVIAATIATLGALAYGLRLFLPGDATGLGLLLIGASSVSIIGGLLRLKRSSRSFVLPVLVCVVIAAGGIFAWIGLLTARGAG